MLGGKFWDGRIARAVREATMAIHSRTVAPLLGGVVLAVTLAASAASEAAEREKSAGGPSTAALQPGTAAATAAEVPAFRVDPFWPQELPNNWILGQASGVAVDARDHVWLLHRPRTLDARQRGEHGMCCVPAPPVIEFAPDGSVVQAWGGPGEGFEWPESEHGIHIDPQGHVWIGGNAAGDAHILKFTADGEFLLQIGRAGASGGSNDTENLGRPAGIRVDPEANEVYVADGYGNRRVIVFDAETGA